MEVYSNPTCRGHDVCSSMNPFVNLFTTDMFRIFYVLRCSICIVLKCLRPKATGRQEMDGGRGQFFGFDSQKAVFLPFWMVHALRRMANGFNKFIGFILTGTAGYLHGLHPRKWSPKMEVWKMIFLLKGVIFRFYVSFGGDISLDIQIPCEDRYLKPQTSPGGSAFKASKHLLIRYDWRTLED